MPAAAHTPDELRAYRRDYAQARTQREYADERRSREAWKRNIVQHAINWHEAGYPIGLQFKDVYKVGLTSVRNFARKLNIPLPAGMRASDP